MVALVKPGQSVCVGYSGGLDSTVLLDVLHLLRAELDFTLSALHVHHGLSPNADAWAVFCAKQCAALGVPLNVARITVAQGGGTGMEAAARNARYGAYATLAADWVALAHHADDNAETFFLRLLRGAGMRGLAAMRGVRPLNARTRIVRPFLHLYRNDLLRYAEAHKLEWIEDESNDNTGYDRNFLRREILPRLAQRFPAYAQSVNRAAAHAAEAQVLLDELAQLDMRGLEGEDVVPLALLRSLSAMRAKNVLRCFLADNGIDMPDSTLLDEAVRQVRECAEDAQIVIEFGEWQLRKHRDGVLLVRAQGDATYPKVPWRGEARLEFGAGVVTFEQTAGQGIRARLAAESGWVLRARTGGERMRPDAGRPTRTLKNLFQEAGTPAWERDRLPLLFHHERLVWAPGIGIDCAYQCAPDEAGMVPRWKTVSAV